MKIPEWCFQWTTVFVAPPVFSGWMECMFEHRVLLINALMPCVNPLHHHMLIIVLRVWQQPLFPTPFSFHCLFVTDLIVILPLLGFNLRSLSGPRGAAGSPRSQLAHGQSPFELPSQPRLWVPLLCVPAWWLPGCWRRPLIYCRWLGKSPRSFHSGWGKIYLRHIWQCWHLGLLWNVLSGDKNKWTVSKICQPQWFSFLWRIGKKDILAKQLFSCELQNSVQNKPNSNDSRGPDRNREGFTV